MSKRKSGMVCAAKNCKNKGYNCNLSFFTFPKKDRPRAQTWLLASCREDLLEKMDKLESYRLCSAHFEDRMYSNDLKTLLLPSAVPTIFPSLEGCSSRSTIINMEAEHNYCIQSSNVGKSVCHRETEDEEPPSKVRILSNILLETPLSIAPVRPPTPPSQLFSPSSTQTALSLSSRTPRKDKLRKLVKKLRNENDQLKKLNQTLHEDLERSKQDTINNISREQYMSLTYRFCPTQELSNFINTQISQVQKNNRKAADIHWNLKTNVLRCTSQVQNSTKKN